MQSRWSLLLLFVVAACCSANQKPAMNQNVQMRVIASGSYARAASAGTSSSAAASTALARNDAEYQQLWRSLIGEAAPPPVDFTHESVVFLLSGRHSTGGYSITPKGVALNGKTLQVDATAAAPGPRTITTMAISAPYSVVAVTRGDYDVAEWRSEGRVMARSDAPFRADEVQQ